MTDQALSRATEVALNMTTAELEALASITKMKEA